MKEKIAKLTQTDTASVNRYLNEPSLSRITERVVESLQGYDRLILGASMRPHKAVADYVLCRLMRPDVVVETGVQSGISSALILQALEDNRGGFLYSIDLPDQNLLEAIPPDRRRGLESGWAVPQELRDRWGLVIGRSQDKLLPLLRQLKAIDIFIHDGEHTLENMYQEYELAWQFLKPGGLLLSDDVHLNHAFETFADNVKRRPTMIMHPLGGIRKP
jgi:predicted O-methyltransferase YrrM